MAKKKKTVNRVGFLLDETGSMNIRRDETIVAVNNYFEGLRQEAVVTFATFDTAQGVNFRHVETKAKDIPDLTEQIAQGQSRPLREWLRTNIHCHGKKFTPAELVRRVAGTEMSATPFLNYLREKYTEIYSL